MKSSSNNGTHTYYLKGRIDSANSSSVELEIMDHIEEFSPSSLVLDATELEYISSAGLRIVLKLRKKFPDLRVINVSSEIYDIFEVTGFTEIVDVEKAYRSFDVTGCEVIGEGANGKVYRVDRDTIVKVYKDSDALDDIKRERDLARTAFVLGIPTAIPYDVVRVGDTYGSVFELLNAKSFQQLLREDINNLDYVVDECVKIMKTIHSTEAPSNLPYQSAEALKWIEEARGYLPDDLLQKLRSMIKALPEEGRMIHGDLHIKNLMYQDGETLLIDMDTLSAGHPIYELAFIFNAYKGFGVADEKKITDFLGISIDTAETILDRVLRGYLGTDDEAVLRETIEKASIIGYLRVMRRVVRMGESDTERGSALIKACREKLIPLLEKYDTLEFA